MERAGSRLVALQEEIDWVIYSAFGLSPETEAQAIDQASKTLEAKSAVPPGGRPFERLTGHHQGFTKRVGQVERHLVPEDAVPSHWRERERVATAKPLASIEKPEFKRTWRFSEQNIHPDKAREATEEEIAAGILLDLLEAQLQAQHRPLTARDLTAQVSSATLQKVMDYFEREMSPESIRAFMQRGAVPFCAAWRLAPKGLEKFRLWERTWDLQREEDAGTLAEICPFPRFTRRRISGIPTIGASAGSSTCPRNASSPTPAVNPTKMVSRSWVGRLESPSADAGTRSSLPAAKERRLARRNGARCKRRSGRQAHPHARRSLGAAPLGETVAQRTE